MNNQNVNYLRARWMIAERRRMDKPGLQTDHDSNRSAMDYIDALKDAVYGPDRKARF